MRSHAPRRPPPEIPLALFGFLLHFLWEVVQCPLLFVGMGESTHADGVAMCLRATVGDVNIVLLAFWGTPLASRRHRRWIVEPRAWERAAFVAIGLTITVAYEVLATRVWLRWTYSAAMPVLFGVGLAPVAQWLVIPPIVLWLTRRGLPTAALAAFFVLLASERALADAPVAAPRVVTHGEPAAADAFRRRLQDAFGWHAVVPDDGSAWTLEPSR